MTDLLDAIETQRELYFEVPGEVRGKGRPRFRIVEPTGEEQFVNTYTDAKTKSYEARIAGYAVQARAKAGWAMVMDRPLRIDVHAQFGVKRSYSKKKKAALIGTPAMNATDTDNILKSVLDALHDIVFQNDKIVAIVTCTKRWVEEGGDRLKIRISTCV